MTVLLNLTINIIMATTGAVNPAVSEVPVGATGFMDVPFTTLKYRDTNSLTELFGVDFDVRQQDRASRLV